MAITVRPPEEADLEALTVIDSEYAARHGLECTVTAGTLRFFGRTEHSFVAQQSSPGSQVLGFVFAQAVWTGDRPQVFVTRIAAAGGGHATHALIKALVKSAYDCGVYDLIARVPDADVQVRALLQEEFFLPDNLATYVRVLGSRGADAVAAAQADRAAPANSREQAGEAVSSRG